MTTPHGSSSSYPLAAVSLSRRASAPELRSSLRPPLAEPQATLDLMENPVSGSPTSGLSFPKGLSAPSSNTHALVPLQGAKTQPVPDHFLDAVTMEVMSDPVFCSDGYTYDRETVEALLSKADAKSPMTRAPLKMVGPNIGLRSAIWDMFPHLSETYKASKKSDFTDEGERNEKGELHGQGIRRYNDGDIFRGTFVDGKAREGSLHGASGSIFTGTFANDQVFNVGRLVSSNGQVSEGEFKNNVMHGRAKLWFGNGDCFSGSMEHGKMHGFGVWQTEKYTYLGEFRNNRAQGNGRLVSGKAVYEGEFVSGEPTGSTSQETNLRGRILALGVHIEFAMSMAR